MDEQESRRRAVGHVDERDSNGNLTLSVEVLGDGDGELTIRVGGELDISNVDVVDAEVSRAMARAPRRLVFEVADLRFADSSAIALWVRWAGSVAEFELRDPSPLVRRVVEAMGLAGKLRPTP
jgi:anti-anti-sigma factor